MFEPNSDYICGWPGGFSPNLQFSPLPTGWHMLKMSEMVLRYLYEKSFYNLLMLPI